jgi:hypothetical protein
VISTGRLVISLDFELHWGVRDSVRVDQYQQNLLGVRQAVPRLLELFRRHEIHATWATVGFLFARNREELLASLPDRRPAYARPVLDPYRALGDELGRDEHDDPYHYASSLLDMIEATTHQEIASHTFSHYYCLEEGQDVASFRDDLVAARAIAQRRGIILCTRWPAENGGTVCCEWLSIRDRSRGFSGMGRRRKEIRYPFSLGIARALRRSVASPGEGRGGPSSGGPDDFRDA